MKTYADIQGDGGSQVAEQLGAQRAAIAARLSSIRHVVAVGSGKGGVGKSTLSMQLACALSAMGKSVALLDADLNGPSIAQISGMQNAPLLPGADGLLLPITEDGIGVLSTGVLLEARSALSFENVAHGDSFTWRATKEFSTLASILAGLEWGSRDILIIDLPPGPERTVQFAEFFGQLLEANRSQLHLLLASIPTDLSLNVVLRGVHALKDVGANILGYVENMNGYLSPESGTIQPLFPKRDQSEVPLKKIASLPFDPQIAALCDRGMRVVDWQACASSKDVEVLAHYIWNQLQSPRGE